MSANKILNIGVIGLGHIGPNHVRVFSQCENAKVQMCADPDAHRREHIEKMYPSIKVVERAEDIIGDKNIGAVVIATPTHTHYALAKLVLEAGKHLFLEKPMCLEYTQAKEIVELAKKNNCALVHGHILLYSQPIQFIRQGILRGDYGNIQYLDTTRTNLGPIRDDINVIYDLATHEFATFDFIFGGLPEWISVAGSRLLGTPREDVAFISMEFPGHILVHTHVSWLHPQKTRQFTLVADKKMVVWDDMDASEPVKIYDKGIAEEPYYDSFKSFQMCLRDSDVHVPKIKLSEPLLVQAQSFVRRVLNNEPTFAEAESGLNVMRCLDACTESLKNNGKRVYLK